MTIEKVHQKLQSQALTIIGELNNFTEPTIQPSVAECENLQKKLHEIQETIIIFKYQKSIKELSPSFNIHSKVSAIVETLPETEKASEITIANAEVQQTNNTTAIIAESSTQPIILEGSKPLTDNSDALSAIINNPTTEKSETKVSAKPLGIALNDKFRFINVLFLHNAAEYNIAIEQINNLNTWAECEMYLSSLNQLYQWSENNEVVKHFFATVKKRFD